MRAGGGIREGLLTSLARKCFRVDYIRMKCICFFGWHRLGVHFRALNDFSAGLYGSAEHNRTMDDLAGLIANAAKVQLFRSTWVDGYAVPKENKVLHSLLMFVAGTDQC